MSFTMKVVLPELCLPTIATAGDGNVVMLTGTPLP